MPSVEDTLRDAGRSCRRVLIRFRSSSGAEQEREMEPYSIQEGRLVAFSLFRDEYRTMPLDEITAVEITPRSFSPRRPVEL